jgi:Fe-S-cluster-containing hydrogenase component 2
LTSTNNYPLHSLQNHQWFKLICGASFQELNVIRNLTLAYALAGADCIDVAADPAVIAVAQSALQVAENLADWLKSRGFPPVKKPWLMVSFNDGEDPHFRKAAFDFQQCPTNCWRPCEKVCPVSAIVFQQPILNQSGASQQAYSGIIDSKCYGCGRCLPVCPSSLIYARSYVSTPQAIAPLISDLAIDAIEIHTQIGREADFARLWQSIRGWVNHLKLLAISCPDGVGLISYLAKLQDIISPLPCSLLWQTDGRPMSGDIGAGTTLAAIKLGQKVLETNLTGYVQLAGGTNNYTIPKLRELKLLPPLVGCHLTNHQRSDKIYSPNSINTDPNSATSESDKYIHGVAYGSYARVLLAPIWEKLEAMQNDQVNDQVNIAEPLHLENFPGLLEEALFLARELVTQIKPEDARKTV